LQGSGTLLAHSDALWGIVSSWLLVQSNDTFIELLPLLRRTFGSFSAPERCELGMRAVHSSGAADGVAALPSAGLDLGRARRVLPILQTIFGIHALEEPIHDK
jgi:hypothetical protein